MLRETTRDDLGLAITMLDSDRLRQWAEKLDTYGANISHWGDSRFVTEQLRAIAGRIEATVREVGTLRELAGLVEPPKKPSTQLRDYLRNVADCRHSDRSDEGGGLVCIACVEAAIDVLGQHAKDVIPAASPAGDWRAEAAANLRQRASNLRGRGALGDRAKADFLEDIADDMYASVTLPSVAEDSPAKPGCREEAAFKAGWQSAVALTDKNGELHDSWDVAFTEWACSSELAPLADALIKEGHKLAKAIGWRCIACDTVVQDTAVDLGTVVCGCGRGNGRWVVELASPVKETPHDA